MHRVTLREMEHFVALAEHGSVTGAAAAIGLSQPAMSTSLRDLERTLGVTLFVRGSDRARVRSVSYEVETPEFPRGASFFSQQEVHGTTPRSGR